MQIHQGSNVLYKDMQLKVEAGLHIVEFASKDPPENCKNIIPKDVRIGVRLGPPTGGTTDKTYSLLFTDRRNL